MILLSVTVKHMKQTQMQYGQLILDDKVDEAIW